MSAAAALHSNHVNYVSSDNATDTNEVLTLPSSQLVWRYLQEQGFEHAAIAFTRDWRRTGDIASDPDALSFAPEVRRNDLVSVVQYGVHYDQARAKAGLNNGERKFAWSKIEGRGSLERQRDPAENGASTRPATGRRKEKPPAVRTVDGARGQPPRASRKSEAGDAHLNGDARDAMDVEPGSVDGEPEQEATSPTVASESDQAGPVERYDSMDVLIQTDIKAGLNSSTISWLLDKPGATIHRAIWNPKPDVDDSKTLLVVGNDLCRFYQIPSSANNAQHLENIDEPNLSTSCCVTAATWRHDGTAACCAIDKLRQLPSGTQLSQQELIERHSNGTSTSLQLGPAMLEPPGIVLGIHYSPDSKYVLALRTNMKRSTIQVWPSFRPDVDTLPLSEPIAWRLFDIQVCDVTWISNDTFAVCGENGLAALYQIDESQSRGLGVLPVGNVLMRGLMSRNSNIVEGTSHWDYVRYDPRYCIAAFVSRADKRLLFTSKLRSGEISSSTDVEFALPEDKLLEPVAFSTEQLVNQGEQIGNTDVESLFAAGFSDGTIGLFSARHSLETGLECKTLGDLTLLESPTTALAWSPDNEHLAASSSNLVQIWSRDSFNKRNGIVPSPRTIFTWRPQDLAGHENGIENEEGNRLVTCQPSLTWSADGRSLAFATEEQVRYLTLCIG